MEYIDRREEIKRKQNLQREQEHWEEVHNNLIEVQQSQRIQKKSLEISSPGDSDEKEADAVARKVVSGESAEIHGTGGTINRKGEGTSETTPEFQSKLESSKGGGQSLDDSTRSEMESKMGADFSGVKIHTGGEANTMSESINAKAFTHGQDVFFKQGEFNTDSKQGQELLAHELVHTVQQGEGKVQTKIQRDGYVPNEGNTSLTGDDRGAMGYLPSESDFADTHKSDTPEAKVKIITDFLNDKNTSDPDAKSFWQKFQALNEKSGPNGTVLVQSLWEQAVKIKEKSDQAVKDIDAVGGSKRTELEGLYVRDFTSRGKRYEKKSADWGHWKEFDPGKYNQVPYDHSDNPLLKYTKNKFHGFGSMMVLDDHFAEGNNATTIALELLSKRLTDEKQFDSDIQGLLENDPDANRFAVLMSALRDISSLVDKLTAAKTASEKTGLPLHYTLALYGQEGNFTMPSSHASLQAGIPVTERGGLNMIAGGKIVDYSTGNLVVKKFGGDPDWNRFWALSSISLQIGGLDVVNNLFTKVLTDNVGSDVATLVKLCIQAAAKWSLGNRTALKGDTTADKTELGRSQTDLEKLWEEQYNGIQGTDKTHRKDASISGLDTATVYAPTDPAKLAGFILQEAGFYFKRTINKGKTVSGWSLPFTPEVGYLMYNSGLHPEFIVQAVKAAYRLSKGTPLTTPSGKLGISNDLLEEIKTLPVAKEGDIISAVVKSWLTPERWKLLMDFIPVAGQDELQLTYKDKGTDVNNFQKQINTSNFSTLAKFYKDVFNVQKKSLDISSPKDASEKEADEVARKVVRGESAQVNRTGGTINRKGESTSETTPELQSKLESRKGGGQSMNDFTRSDMESKMGADLSGVKIHTDGEANTMSESINAKAFTYGQDIYFKQGLYDPESKEGKELLAHEVVHTQQQQLSGGVFAKLFRRKDKNPDVSKMETYIDKKVTGLETKLDGLNKKTDRTAYDDTKKLIKKYGDLKKALRTEMNDNLDFTWDAGLQNYRFFLQTYPAGESADFYKTELNSVFGADIAAEQLNEEFSSHNIQSDDLSKNTRDKFTQTKYEKAVVRSDDKGTVQGRLEAMSDDALITYTIEIIKKEEAKPEDDVYADTEVKMILGDRINEWDWETIIKAAPNHKDDIAWPMMQDRMKGLSKQNTISEMLDIFEKHKTEKENPAVVFLINELNNKLMEVSVSEHYDYVAKYILTPEWELFRPALKTHAGYLDRTDRPEEKTHNEEEFGMFLERMRFRQPGHGVKEDYDKGVIRSQKVLVLDKIKGTPKKQGESEIYFEAGDEVTRIGTDEATKVWVNVKGTGHYIENGNKVDTETEGWIKRADTNMTLGVFEGLNIVDRTARTDLGDLSSDIPMKPKINAIILHQTASRFAESTLTSYKKRNVAERGGLTSDPNYKAKNEGAQYLIAPNGEITLVVPINEMVNHIGVEQERKDVFKFTEHGPKDMAKVMQRIKEMFDDNAITFDVYDRFNKLYNGGKGSANLYNELLKINGNKVDGDWYIFPYADIEGNVQSVGIEVASAARYLVPEADPTREYTPEGWAGLRKKILIDLKDVALIDRRLATKEDEREAIVNSTDLMLYPDIHSKDVAIEKLDVLAYSELKAKKWMVGAVQVIQPIDFSYSRGSTYAQAVKAGAWQPLMDKIMTLNLSAEFADQLEVTRLKELEQKKIDGTITNKEKEEYDLVAASVYKSLSSHGFVLYEDITPEQKYSSWLLVNKLAQQFGLNMSTDLYEHTVLKRKAFGEGVANLEFIHTMTDIKKWIGQLSNLEDPSVDSQIEEYVQIIDKLDRFVAKDPQVLAFFTNFYDHKKTIEALKLKYVK